MVEQVTKVVWKASDNTEFDTQLEAIEHETALKLRDGDLFKRETIHAIIANAEMVYDALGSLVGALQRETLDRTELLAEQPQSESVDG